MSFSAVLVFGVFGLLAVLFGLSLRGLTDSRKRTMERAVILEIMSAERGNGVPGDYLLDLLGQHRFSEKDSMECVLDLLERGLLARGYVGGAAHRSDDWGKMIFSLTFDGRAVASAYFE